MTPRTADELDELYAEFLDAIDRGQPLDPAEWIARHPRHAAQLAAFLADLDWFGGFLGLPSPASVDLTVDYVPSGDEAAEVGPACERFAEYELLGEPIGVGGMGVVYRARLVGTILEVALKQIRGDGGYDIARFREEIEAAGMRHPNVVPIYHAGEYAGRPFFTMPLMADSLDRRLARYRDDPRAAAELVAKVARAVHHAHKRGILHRDLKPSNILLDENGTPHVADFGLAARLTAAGTTVGVGPPAGSLPWMAPEAIRGGQPLTTAVDVWSLGVVLYELLTGVRPFTGPDRDALADAILTREPVPPRAVNRRVPRGLDAICLRCLDKNPDRRYESASAVALDVERWSRDETVRAQQLGYGEREPRWGRFVRWCRRNPGVAGGVVFLASLLLAITAASVSLADELEDRVVADVCRDCEYDAAQVAGNVLQRFDRLGGAVRNAAAELRNRPPPTDGVEKAAVVSRLETLVLKPVNPGGARPFVNAFVLDPAGAMRATWPLNVNINPGGYPGRDYFTAARGDAAHVSRVFLSENDGLDKLAVSIRFRPKDADADWVLAATVTTDDRLDLGVVSMSDERHTATLIVPRDSAPPRPGAAAEPEEYVVIVHPALAPRTPTVRFGSELPAPPGGAANEFGPAPPERIRPFGPNRDFRDPMASRDPAYAGRWLTGAARVGNTELVVVVQQRYDEAVGPHRAYTRRLIVWVSVAVAVGLVAFAGFRALGSRRTARVASIS